MRYLLGVSLVALCFGATPQTYAGAPASPEAVLHELERVYASGDAEQLDHLLSDDYAFLSHAGQQWGASKEIEMTRLLFDQHRVALIFEREFRMLKGDEQGTWVIQGIPARLEVSPKESNTDGFSVEATVALYVRQQDSDSYEIYRWVEQK